MLEAGAIVKVIVVSETTFQVPLAARRGVSWTLNSTSDTPPWLWKPKPVMVKTVPPLPGAEFGVIDVAS